MLRRVHIVVEDSQNTGIPIDEFEGDGTHVVGVTEFKTKAFRAGDATQHCRSVASDVHSAFQVAPFEEVHFYLTWENWRMIRTLAVTIDQLPNRLITVEYLQGPESDEARRLFEENR